MLCQKCGKRHATTHIRRNIGGSVTEWHLCAVCAGSEDIAPAFSGLMPDFWGSLFGDTVSAAAADTTRCEGCGRSFADIAESGKVGCAKCYTTFYDRLLPSIQRIHGRTAHVGRTPAVGEAGSKRKSEIEQLKAQLQQQVQAQNYEECARLRDRIHQLQQEETHHE